MSGIVRNGRYTTAMCVNFLNDCANESSTLKKKEIIYDYYIRYEERFLCFINDLLSPDITFGLDKKTLSSEGIQKYAQDMPDLELYDVISYLKTHNTSNDYSKTVACSLLKIYQDDESYFEPIQNFLLRKPRAGVDIKNVNSALEFLGVKVVKQYTVQLASPFRALPSVAIIEPKLDGVRITAHLKLNKEIELYTRNGKRVYGYTDLEIALTNLIETQNQEYPVSGYVLDGEIVSGNFDETMEGLFRNTSMKKGKYVVWDIIPIHEFINEVSNSTLSERKIYLKNALDSVINAEVRDTIDVIDYYFVTNEEFLAVKHQEFCDDGYEGSIVKDANAKYEYKRSFSWQKIKDFHTFDFIIVELEEGTGKYSGTLGAVWINVSGKKVKVGSGFSDEQRDSVWNNPEYYIGKYIEVQYQEITKDGSLRFPSFKRFRFDK